MISSFFIVPIIIIRYNNPVDGQVISSHGLHADKQQRQLTNAHSLFLHSQRWTNTSINTLTCPHCSATFTIKLFHPQLGRDGTKTLCRYYQRKLLTSHDDSCPFSFLARRYDDDNEEEVGEGREWVWSEDCTSQNGVRLMARLFDVWRSRRMMVVVPPSLDEVLRRNDCGVGVGSSLLQRLYNVVTTEEEEEEERPLSEDGVLLSLLGWSPVPSSSTSGGDETATCRSIMVECRVCLARASVPFMIESDDDTDVQGIDTTTTTAMKENCNNDEAKQPKTKRRRINTLGMNPLTCHRSYCPYITTRGISDCFESPSSEDDVGWMTVAKQLIRQTVSLRGVVAQDDGDDKLRVTTGEETLAAVKSVFNSCLGTTTGMVAKGKKTATTMVGRRE